MELELIERMRPEAWDEAIASFDSGLIFHRSAWLGFLEETNRGKLLRFRIVQDGATAGYFVGLLTKKGFFTVLGSPLTGWLTDYLGPAVNPGFDVSGFLRALDDVCREWRVDFLQIGNPILEPELMRKRGFGLSESRIFSIPLTSCQTWQRLTCKCRNRIRKGWRNGLVVEDDGDPAFVDEYYAQHVEVFARQNLPPKYPIETVRALYSHLKPRDMLFTLSVKNGSRTIATGLFPHDERMAFSFGIASRIGDRHLCPNELLYWTAMCAAEARGIQALGIGGTYRPAGAGTSFKEKFGGNELSVYRYSRSYSPLATIGHKAYQALEYVRRRRHRVHGR